MSESTSPPEQKRVMSSLRANPWMVSTLVLGVLFLVALFFASRGTGFSGMTGNVISESDISQKVLAYAASAGVDGATVSSVSRTGNAYTVTVAVNGQQVPLLLSLDGQYLLQPFEAAPSAQTPPAPPAPTAGPVTIDPTKIARAPVKGNVNAPVTIVEFSDYECPFCDRFYTDAIKQIDELYIKTGKVKLVYMNFPLGFHPEAEPAARAALCFRKVKGGSDTAYFSYHDTLFENQASLSTANYKQWARDLGANGASFDGCFDSGEFADQVAADSAYGSSLGVSGTPTSFINGVEVVGAQPFSSVKQIIEAELAK